VTPTLVTPLIFINYGDNRLDEFLDKIHAEKSANHDITAKQN